MNEKIFVYAGTWSIQSPDVGKGGIGIYQYDIDSGSLTYLDTVRTDLTAGMIAVNQKHSILYVIDETLHHPAFGGKGGGGRIFSFHIDPQSGMLTQIGSEQPTYGTLPAYIALNGSGDWLIACNHSDDAPITKFYKSDDGRYHVTTEYSMTTAALYPVGSDGSAQPACDIITFSEDRSRIPALTACLHCVSFAGDDDHFVMTNMKQDMILSYRLDKKTGTCIECGRVFARRGNFPRYFTFHPKLKCIYLNNEHVHVLDVLSYNDKWRLTFIQTLDVTPHIDGDMTGKKVMQTDIRISADGKHLYDLFRGPNAIFVFDIDENSGYLSLKQEFRMPGEGNLRGCAISPDGKFMLVADNASHRILSLEILDDGTLRDTGCFDEHLRYPANLSFYVS